MGSRAGKMRKPGRSVGAQHPNSWSSRMREEKIENAPLLLEWGGSRLKGVTGARRDTRKQIHAGVA